MAELEVQSRCLVQSFQHVHLTVPPEIQASMTPHGAASASGVGRGWGRNPAGKRTALPWERMAAGGCPRPSREMAPSTGHLSLIRLLLKSQMCVFPEAWGGGGHTNHSFLGNGVLEFSPVQKEGWSKAPVDGTSVGQDPSRHSRGWMQSWKERGGGVGGPKTQTPVDGASGRG